jgi:hypothetical protein
VNYAITFGQTALNADFLDNEQTETPEQREQQLAQLTARGRRLIEAILAQHPLLTAQEAVEHVREMGGPL